MSDSLLVGVRETARLLGVSVRTVERLIAEGAINSVKVRKRRLVNRADVIAFSERGTEVRSLEGFRGRNDE